MVKKGGTLIGEAERSLRTRFMEHCRLSTTTSEVSWHLHMDFPGHTISLEVAKILEMEPRNFERGVKDTIHIRVHKPTLNRDGGASCYHRCELTYSNPT